MDVTSKYRARHPPKEHEEAVRMLLEGIASANSNNNNSNNNSKQQASEIRTTALSSYGGQYRHSSSGAVAVASSDEDDDELIVDPQVEQPAPIHPLIGKGLRKTISKATSTSCDDDNEDQDSMASSGDNSNNHGPMYREPVPSRTIAVQCDRKSSAHKRDHLFDASMQASSISSTRYGFYSYTPEVLENRRKLQSSTSSRNINSDRQQIEAPTSISELSESENASLVIEGDDELQTTSSRTNHNNKQRQRDEEESSQTARARINSLPRRPVTAMSYVSSSRIRGDQSTLDIRSHQNRISAASRTMSQQTLVRARTPAPPEPSSSASNSDSELEAHQIRYRQQQQQQVPHSEELLVNKRGVSVPNKPPRPTLVATSSSSTLNANARNYRTLERVPTRDSSVERPTSRLVVGPTSVTRRTLTSDLYQPHNGRPQLSHTINRRPSTISRRSTYNNRVEDNDDNENHLPCSSKVSRPIANTNTDANAHQSSSEQSGDAQYHRTGSRSSSMSLSRRPKVLRTTNHDGMMDRATSNYCTTSRNNCKLNRHNRAYSQSQLTKPALYVPSPIARPQVNSDERDYELGRDVSRWTSMRHIDRSSHDQLRPSQRQQNYLIAQEFELKQQQEQEISGTKSIFNSASKFDHRQYDYGEEEEAEEVEEDSESSMTKTWANPSHHKSHLSPMSTDQNTRKSSRSYSERTTNNNNYHEDYSYRTLQQNQQKADQSSYNSSSESSVLDTVLHHRRGQHFLRPLQPLQHHDSQQRLNEIGLPEVNSAGRRQEPSAHSYLGLSSDHHLCGRTPDNPVEAGRLPTKPGQITGRAMSQQSLVRPTMPSRRRGGASNSGGSDVGGSSMSLVSRLQGKYENAHTRSPIVMYIPQASTTTSRLSVLGADGATICHKTSTLRKSSRSRQKSSSQDRSRRSMSRNGSDSESSSMLRTLVRPRGSRLQGHHASKRSKLVADHHNHHDNDEDVDGVGQLATEVDSYKFRRRYSVPKDAKINWFAKLKQRVSSSGGK